MIALLLAAGLAVGSSLVGTKLLIDWLTARKVGQPIHEDVPQGHTVKAGTPTDGRGRHRRWPSVIGYLAAHVRSGLVFTRTGVLVMACIVGAGLVGLIDDWIKVSNERNLGLTKRAKTAGLLLVAVGFAVSTVLWLTDVETTLSFTRWNVPGWELGAVGWCVWAVLLIYATSNGVNLTDGLDGLAAGSSIFVFSCLMVIGFWALPALRDLPASTTRSTSRSWQPRWWAPVPASCGGTRRPRASSWATPARSPSAPAWPRIVLTLNVQLLLPIVGALYVTESLSVILQVGSFRLFKRRIFRMAPIHHHFELGGWPETTVIIRFWLLAGMCTALALGLYYADWIATGGVD